MKNIAEPIRKKEYKEILAWAQQQTEKELLLHIRKTVSTINYRKMHRESTKRDASCFFKKITTHYNEINNYLEIKPDIQIENKLKILKK